MKNILHVIDTTGPGGAETVFTQLAKLSTELGYRSTALIRGAGWVKSELERYEIPHDVIDCKGSMNFRYLKALINIIKRDNIDVIHSHLLGSNVYCSIAGLITGKKVICTFHGQVDISEKESFKLLKLLSLSLGAAHIVTVTDKLREKVYSLPLIKRNKVTTIFNGIDTSAFRKVHSSKLREELDIPDDSILIGSLGNIRPAKNYPLAIKTIAKLHEKGISVHYAIAGQFSDKQVAPLKELINEFELTKYIHLLGFTDSPSDFLSSLDIFFMSSSSEGHPLALTQAMANKLPIVSTKSGIEEILTDNVSGKIDSSNTPENLSNLLISLINQPSDAQFLANNAYEEATTKYSLTAMLNNYSKLYEQ